MNDWSPSQHELERRRIRSRTRARSALIATGMTVLAFALVALVVTNAPGWPRTKEYFLSWPDAKESLPAVWDALWLNIQMFLIAEVFILVFAMLIAIARVSRSPWLMPLRIVAVAYTDIVRGIPTILLVYIFAFGMPALELQGLPDSPFLWATAALIVSYSAYVAEVLRSGILSVHPSQWASADALGLSRAQALRHVIVPQALRRVVPPLLNDFVSLQKDTALASAAGVFETVANARDYTLYNFNFTPYLVVAVFFIAMTVPLARFTDWLTARMRERELAGAV